MTIADKPRLKDLVVDKEMLIRMTDEQNARSGFVPDPTATAERARQMMLDEGVRPEDRISTRELLAMREE